MISKSTSTAAPAYGIGIPGSEPGSTLSLLDEAVHALPLRFSAGAEGMLAQHAAADTACSRQGLLWGTRQTEASQGSPEAGLLIEEATALPSTHAFGVALQSMDLDRLIQYASRQTLFLMGSYAVWPIGGQAAPWHGEAFRGTVDMDPVSGVLQKRFVHVGIRWTQRRFNAFRVPPPTHWGALELAVCTTVH